MTGKVFQIGSTGKNLSDRSHCGYTRAFWIYLGNEGGTNRIKYKDEKGNFSGKEGSVEQ
jgi:hypothetical protein